MKLVLLGLAVLYPLLAHLAVARADPALAVAAVAVLAAIVLGPGLLRRRGWAFVAAIGVVVALVLGARGPLPSLLILLPPVLVPAMLAYAFGRTLRAGRVPLVERFARAIHGDGPLDPAIPPYARRVTRLWAVFLALLAAVNAVLGLIAVPGGALALAGLSPTPSVPREAWSFVGNVLGYLLVAAVFVGEYAWRRRRFPALPYASFAEFGQRLRAIGPALLREATR